MSAFDCFERVGTDDGGNSFFIFHSNRSPKYLSKKNTTTCSFVLIMLFSPSQGNGGADYRVGGRAGILRVGIQATIFTTRKHVEIQKPNVWSSSSSRLKLFSSDECMYVYA